jgi:uncharacterized protein YjgD (DUF1641 family)
MDQALTAPDPVVPDLVASDLAALNEKIDLLAAQVQFLTEQAQLAARRREERAELMHDVIPIANDAFRTATEQLEEVQDYVDLGDLLRLIKRLLRNGRNIEKMLDQLESLADLVQTVGPLSDSAFEKATDLLQTAEQRGYFAFAKGGARIVDNVIKDMTPAQPVDTLLRSLLSQMRDPDVRRGLALSMRLLGVIGAHAAGKQPT